jgi:hypothetical protein
MGQNITGQEDTLSSKSRYDDVVVHGSVSPFSSVRRPFAIRFPSSIRAK